MSDDRDDDPLHCVGHDVPSSSGLARARASRRVTYPRPRRLHVDAAVGRISCESIAGYPPGIPALLPGERITAETVQYLRDLVDSGARLHGASDPLFDQVHVLAGS